MVTEFNGFDKGVIGKKLPSDTTLNNMKKADLIELLHLAQQNYDSLRWFYGNAVNVNIEKLAKMDSKEIRNKAIDEFAERLRLNTSEYEIMDGFGVIEEIVDAVDVDKIWEIAEKMKGE